MSDLAEPSKTEAAMRKAAMSLPPSDFGSHRAIQAAARAADDLIAPYRARIAALEGDADMVDEREMRSNLRIEALEAAGRQLATAIKAVQPEMRREHDAGDGHFSTDEVEAVETALAAWRTAAKGDRGE